MGVDAESPAAAVRVLGAGGGAPGAASDAGSGVPARTTPTLRQDGSTRAILAWIDHVLGTGPRRVDRTVLASLLTPLGWTVTFPEGDVTTATVHSTVADRTVLIRYDGSPFTARYRREPPGRPDVARLAVVEIVHEGHGVFVRDGEASPVGPGDMLLHPPQGRHRVEWTSPRCRRTYVLVGTAVFGRRTDAVLRAEDLVQRAAPLAPAAERLVDVLLVPGVDPIVSLTAAQALQALVRATVTGAIDRGHPLDLELRDRARAVLLQRFADPALDADAVARELRVSRRHLFAQFEKSTDTFATTLRDIRLDHAAELLAGADDGMAVRRVARESGFNGPAQLARAFRERFGVTPTQFRAAALRGLPLPGGR